MHGLDAIDIKILHLLQKDGRMTNKELAAELDMSITPVFERVRKLERRGYIQNYIALVDPFKIGKGLIVFLTLKLVKHKTELVEQLEAAVQCLPEVMECYHIAGDEDFMLKIMVKDMPEYENFVRSKLTHIDNIAHVKSNFVLSVAKHKTDFFIQENDVPR